jgi:hypothetical protein
MAEFWTCKGKGGRYKVLTNVNEYDIVNAAKGAGLSRDGDHLVVYFDIVTKAIYYRTTPDFFNRMRRILECPDCEARQVIFDNEE